MFGFSCFATILLDWSNPNQSEVQWYFPLWSLLYANNNQCLPKSNLQSYLSTKTFQREKLKARNSGFKFWRALLTYFHLSQTNLVDGMTTKFAFEYNDNDSNECILKKLFQFQFKIETHSHLDNSRERAQSSVQIERSPTLDFSRVC